MKILLLGPQRPPMIEVLSSLGDEVLTTDSVLTPGEVEALGAEFLVSYGYRHILKAEMLALFPRRAVNLHISLLPWNRGADPNLWSFLEDTPKGVTIHHLAPGIDTGEVLAQREIGFRPDDTLRTSYERLSRAIEELFRQAWPAMRTCELSSTPQAPGGSYHRLKDREPYESLLTHGWDTPVRPLIGAALRRGYSDA